METSEQCVKSVQIQQQKHQNDVIDIILVSDFTPCPNVSIIEFEKVNVSSKSPKTNRLIKY